MDIDIHKFIQLTNLPTKIILSFSSIGLYIYSNVCLAALPDGIVANFLSPLLHANIFHLLTNLFVLWSIRGKIEWRKAFLLALLIVFILPYKVVGLSGFLFATFGLMWGKVKDIKGAIRISSPIIAISFLLPNISGLAHLLAFYIGYYTNRFIPIVLLRLKHHHK